MHLSPPTWIKTALAGVIFMMAFLLTPRAWVDEEQQPHQSQAQIPVQWLQGPDDQEDCLWCSPELKPVNCTEQDEPSSQERLWLNPDAPLPSPSQQPCIQAQDSEPVEPHT